MAALLHPSLLIALLHPSLLIASLVLFLAARSSANEGNILLTGDVLSTDSQLSYAGAAFVMQGDCNLVLYNLGRGFQSDTHGNGVNCTLSLSDQGQLIITSSDGSQVWTSPTEEGRKAKKGGKYAAVLRPDGEVAVYGPAVWSTPAVNSTAGRPEEEELAAITAVQNVLFSSQTLYSDARLSSRDYTFVMREDCNLELIKAETRVVWQSGTAERGRHCFARLDHRGQLAVVGDHYYMVHWSSKSVAADGDYVLILQINGLAVIYGPVVWSTIYS